MPERRLPCLVGTWLVLTAALGVVACAAVPRADIVPPADEEDRRGMPDDCVAGFYEGSATEIATGLELSADGRFRYALTYGALDERAEGNWEIASGKVVLTSDTLTPPEFRLIGQNPSTDQNLHIALDLPKGMSRQYFDAQLGFADGSSVSYQFAEDGLVVTEPDHTRPITVRLLLPMFGVRSVANPVSGEHAQVLRFRFDPNDLGKVGFQRDPLRRDGPDLLLERFGRVLRFRPVTGGCGEPAQP